MKRLRLNRDEIFALPCIGYLLLRLWHLTASCLWFDEIFSVHAAKHSWDSILAFVAQDLIHPPLFYVLLKLWIGMGGDGVYSLRSLPVLLSFLAILPFYFLCWELKLTFWTRIFALFLFATNGSLIKYAQEVRMYSLLLFLSLFSIWLFARYFIKGKSFVALVIVNVLLVYTHYFGWFVVVTEVAAILAYQRIKWRPIVVMFGISLVSFLPWILAVWSAARSGSDVAQNIGWMTQPGPAAIWQLILNLIEPFYFPGSSVEAISIYKVSLPILLVAVIAIVLFFAKGQHKAEGGERLLKLPVLFLVGPLSIAFVASWLFPLSIWGTRHLIIVFAPACILLAVVINRIAIPVVRIAAISLIVLLNCYAFVIATQRKTPAYSWCAWEPLTAYAVETRPVPIYAFEDLVAYHLWFDLVQEGKSDIPVFKVRDMEGVREDKAYFLPRGFDDVKTVDPAEVTGDRFWIAYRGDRIDETKPPLKAFLDRGYRATERKVFAVSRENAMMVLLEK